MTAFHTTQMIEASLLGLREGDEHALNDLIQNTQNRISRLAGKMLRQFPGVQRWQETDDIVQDVNERLLSALASQPPESATHFLRLVASIMRRRLIDLARKYRGKHSHAAHHLTQSGVTDAPRRYDQGSRTLDPESLHRWTAIHEAAEKLPEELRDVFDQMYYNGLSATETQEVLKLDPKTIRRRWLQARLQIQKSIDPVLDEKESRA